MRTCKQAGCGPKWLCPLPRVSLAEKIPIARQKDSQLITDEHML